jgi:hypothetical protein
MPAKKRTPTKKARRAMTTGNATETTSKPNHKPKEGKPIAEMTHAEHKAYLIREAEENEKVNDEIYQRTVDAIPSTDEVQTPTSATNDELREKAIEQTKAATAKQVKK